MLDRAMISYITFGERVLFIELTETWNEFHGSSVNMALFGHMTFAELRDDFLTRILPNIFNYDLSDNERRTIKMLDLHKEYKSNNFGYERISKDERLAASREPKAMIDYRLESYSFELPHSERCVPQHLKLNDCDGNGNDNNTDNVDTHTVIMERSHHEQWIGNHSQINAENHALLSAIVSNDLELSGHKLIDTVELRQRFRAAKHRFEQSGQMPRNYLPANELFKKIDQLHQIRQALAIIANLNTT